MFFIISIISLICRYWAQKKAPACDCECLVLVTWSLGSWSLNLLPCDSISLAVTNDEQHTVTENLGALYLVDLYILHCSFSAFVTLDRDCDAIVMCSFLTSNPIKIISRYCGSTFEDTLNGDVVIFRSLFGTYLNLVATRCIHVAVAIIIIII